MASKIKGYIGARRPENEHRWFSLLDAAMNQANPTSELVKAIQELKKKPKPKYWERKQNVSAV